MLVQPHKHQSNENQIYRLFQRLRWVILIITLVILIMAFLLFAANLWILKSQRTNVLPLLLTVFTSILALFSLALVITTWRLPFSSKKAQSFAPTSTLSPQLTIATNTFITEVLSKQSNSVFLVNTPLIDFKQFLGREREREILITRSRNGACTSIVGANRVGKTWLMNYLKLVAQKELGPRFLVGYLDATAPSCSTVEGFVANALEQLGCANSVTDRTKLGLVDLENALKKLRAKLITPILCIDEFEALRNQEEFNHEFFTQLRAITQLGLSLVTASKLSLVDIVSDQVKTSPFFNIFQELALKSFSSKEVESFIRIKGTQAGFTAQEQEHFLRFGEQLSPRLPLHLQLAGQLMLEDKNQATEENSDCYRPDDPSYWQDFTERLEERYQAIIP